MKSIWSFANEMFLSNVTLMTSDRFTKGNVLRSAVFVPRHNCVIGSLFAKPISGGTGMVMFSGLTENRRLCFGTSVLRGEVNSTSFSVARFVDDKTVVCSTFEFNPTSSESRVVFHGTFLCSRVSAAVSTQGTIQSLYQRRILEKILLSISGFADLIGTRHTVGISVTVEE